MECRPANHSSKMLPGRSKRGDIVCVCVCVCISCVCVCVNVSMYVGVYVRERYSVYVYVCVLGERVCMCAGEKRERAKQRGRVREANSLVEVISQYLFFW